MVHYSHRTIDSTRQLLAVNYPRPVSKLSRDDTPQVIQKLVLTQFKLHNGYKTGLKRLK